MRSQKTYNFIILIVLLIIRTNGISQTIPATDTGTPGFAVSPVDWLSSPGTTDVSDKDYLAGLTLWQTPTVNPPNGHTDWISGTFFETAVTTMTGLSIGDGYFFNFYMCELENCGSGPGIDGTLQVSIGGDLFFFPFTGGDDPTWTLQTLFFTATDASMDISFKYDPLDSPTCHHWNISIDSDAFEPACDDLITLVSDTEICFGEEVLLNAASVNDGLITWDGGVINGDPFSSPLGTTTYTAISDYDDDCSFSVNITVLDVPEITASVDDENICIGESITFTGDGGDVYIWDMDVDDGVPFTPDIIGTNTYTVTGIDLTTGCGNTASIDVTVNDLPLISGFVDYDTICLGESVLFSSDGDVDVASWDFGIIEGTPYFPAELGTETYTLTGLNIGTGCSAYTNVEVTVILIPTVEITLADTEVCEGDLVTLTGIGAATYSWDGGVTDGIAFEPPLGTTTYTVTGAILSGCENTASIDILVNPLPEITPFADEIEVCEGDEIILTGSGADSYTWDLGVIDNEPFIPAETGTITYTVIGTDEFGCAGIATIDILVNESPTVIATASPSEICEGESTTLTGSGADIYFWDGGVVDGIAFTPDETGDIEYNVIATDIETGCYNNASITVTVNENPTITASATFLELCLGEYTTLNGSGATTYNWDNGVVDGISFAPALLGPITYTVIGTNENGCEGTGSITINVLDCQPVLAGFELPNSVCMNDCISVKDTSVGDVTSWEWDFGMAAEPNTSTLQNPIVCTSTPGVYTITLIVTSETGATSTHSEEITVYESPILEAGNDTIIDLGGTAILFANSSSPGEYTWTPFNQVDCPECPISTATPSLTEMYTVELIDFNGCKAIDSVMVMVNFRLNIGVPTAFSPNNDGNNDILFVKGQGLESIYFAVYNRYGELIFETTDQNIGWDGTHSNKDENPGVFTWVLDYTTQDGKNGRLKGNTTLIR